MGGAADVPGNETALPATHVLRKPLPVFLAQIITAALARNPGAATVEASVTIFARGSPGRCRAPKTAFLK